MKVAIVGSCGFIGSHLMKRLQELGTETIGIDISEGTDITDWRQARDIKGFDLLFHLAAKSYVPDSYKQPRSFYHLNVVGTLNSLELCRINKARMVFVSSYVYGKPEYLPIDEKHPVSAFNPYAHSKIMGEDLCRAYNKDFGLPVIIVRPFNIYGEGQNENFLIPTIINQAKNGKVVLKDPKPKRDFLFIDDFVELLVKLIDYGGADYEIFNAGSGKSYSVMELVEIIREIFGGDFEVGFQKEQRVSEVMDTVADISKSQKLLRWNPKVPLRQGLLELCNMRNS